MRYTLFAAALAAPAFATLDLAGGLDAETPIVNAKGGVAAGLGKRHGTPTRRHLAQISAAAGLDANVLGLVDVDTGLALDADVLRKRLLDNLLTAPDLDVLNGNDVDILSERALNHNEAEDLLSTDAALGISARSVDGELAAGLDLNVLDLIKAKAGASGDVDVLKRAISDLPADILEKAVKITQSLPAAKREILGLATGAGLDLETPVADLAGGAGLDLGLGKRTDESCPLAPVLDTAKSTIEPLVEQIKAALNECTDGSLDQKLHDDIESLLLAIVKAVEDLLAAVLGLAPAPSKRAVDVMKQMKRNGAGDDSCQQEVASTLADILNEVICLLNEIETKVTDLDLPIVDGLLTFVLSQLNGPLGQVLQLVQTILPGVLGLVCQILATLGPVLSLLTGLLGSLPGLNILTGILSGFGLGNLLGGL